MSIRHTLHQIPERMRGREGAVPSVVQRFLKDIAERVDRGMVDRLRGGTAPGDYPVPSRIGTLKGSAGHTARPRQSVVYNKAKYARAVHEGFHAYGNPNAPYYGPRRFLADAIADVDPVERLADAWGRVP